MAKRSGRKSAAQTPAPKAEQIKGSKKNPKGTAASEASASKIKLSEKTIDSLRNKLDEFKAKYPSKKNVNLNDLKAVYRRGSGAYSKSHRPTITGGKPNSRAAWSFARVNKFLEKAAGKPVKKAYVQDDDLLKYQNPDIRYENGGKLSTLNPTGSVFTEYSSKEIDELLLDDNITTYNITAELKPDDEVVVYRGVPKHVDEIVSGDFVTTNKQLAKDYAGEGKVLSKIVRADEILDDKTEPLGEEYILRLKSNKMENGGQEIQCVNCLWTWNTADSDASDMYVCHKCDFDNSLFYDGGILKPTLTIDEIAEKHNVDVDYVLDKLLEGGEHELEHTKKPDIAKAIALHHLAEDVDYYDKLNAIHIEDGAVIDDVILENNEPVEVDIIEYLMQQRAEADDVKYCSDSRIFKTMICKTKIDVAERRMMQTENPEEQNVWNECVMIWSDCMNDIVQNNIPEREYKDGGQPCGCGKMYADGGLAYGNSHDKGGIPLEVSSTGQKIEIEGGEGVVNKRSMQMTKKLQFEGKKLTPCEVVSKINEMGGGVKFKCADVAEIIAEDGHF